MQEMTHRHSRELDIFYNRPLAKIKWCDKLVA